MPNCSLDQPPDALAGPPGSGVARRLGAVEQPLLPLRQVRGAELRLASSAAGMAERLGAALCRLLRPAADALLRDAEAAGASWLNMVERFFRDLTAQRLRRGVFRSVGELVVAIEDCLAQHNQQPKPFIWTAKASDILEKVKRGRAALAALHKLQSA